MTAIAVAADPYHRAAVAYGQSESAQIADEFVDQVLRPVSPAARFEKRSAFEWLIWLSASDPGLGGLIDAARGNLESRRVEHDGVARFLDVCMGIAVGAELADAVTVAAITDCADAALSTAIVQHQTVVFADSMAPEQIRKDVDIATRLSGSDGNDFVLHYQPIVTLSDRRTVGYESLLRWNTEAGLLSPDVFLAVAEDTSLIVPIGRHAIDDAVRTLATEVAPTIGDSAFVSLNLSAQQLWDSTIVTFVQERIEANAVEPERVWIEIRENEAVDLGTPAARAVQQLHEIGCTICIDDLGSGFSALRYVRDLPVDVVKVDKTLIDGVLDDSASGAVVHAICDVAQSTGIGMVAEGVEDQELVPALTELGFEFAQGYLFGKPLPHPR
ncbi:EAL domain-containing protein [Gordonia sp. LSe1-13]|uniref:EAL domain-containing protein n=2 Tax=Gordonia sesuvii TaxID=3116777 RepID=A0ABU7MEK7_9ACTN|nr:EAL domain-containing protein [Gordonia sp. LSe1-13]